MTSQRKPRNFSLHLPTFKHDSRSSSPDLYSPGTPGSTTSVNSTYRLSSGGPAVSPSAASQKRKSWLFRSDKQKDGGDANPLAWVVATQGEKATYDLDNITNAQPLPELWEDEGDCLVYLFPQKSGKSPFFKVQSSIFATSRRLTDLSLESRHGEGDSIGQHVRHLYMPITVEQTSRPSSRASREGISEETEELIAVRNLFAFLTAKPLVATRHRPSAFDIFVKLSQLLKTNEFTNAEGSGHGDLVTTNFSACAAQLDLADVRSSLEKAIEGVVLGERMKDIKMYHESFTHAVGRWDAMLDFDSPKFRLVSPLTLNRLNRAAMDLNKRTITVWRFLQDLEFPSLFSGIMDSKTAEERKYVQFDKWKDSFFATRKFFIDFYKHRYKSWPPKPFSKDSASLNRMVLQDIYRDLCSVYDLIIEHGSRVDTLSNRPVGEDAIVRALHQVFLEYNTSSPPVKPSIPFDVPIIPSLKATQSDFGTNEKKDAKAVTKKLKNDEISKVLAAAHNSIVGLTEFSKAFQAMECKAAHSCNAREIVEHRMGQWIFVHAVLQLLPILVVDAPELWYTKDVEYFLCVPPNSGVPWGREEALRGNGQHSEGAANAAARLPADLVEPGIEGIYRRSHCWTKAQKWTSSDPAITPLIPTIQCTDDPLTLHSPAGLLRPAGSRVKSLTNPQRPRPVSVYDPTKTFDSILGGKASKVTN